MINKEFIEETDKIIAKIRERGIQLENGNVLVAKVKADKVTKGGILLADTATDKADYQSGFSRILALPPLTEDDAKLKVGDYVMHSHEARYKPYTPAIRDVLDYVVADNFIYAVQDNEIILQISAEQLT